MTDDLTCEFCGKTLYIGRDVTQGTRLPELVKCGAIYAHAGSYQCSGDGAPHTPPIKEKHSWPFHSPGPPENVDLDVWAAIMALAGD